ncbi:UDP-glucose/GDP-mannose dehydrogenase family protein [Heliorestis acidaminivorans]|uniref:UDP-glucose 6-dehydrogenase n=1 Tax=Heliorestis acidaminivorans TaxID=553427 RepID=A0A6I0F0D9_9FIRM|nr:UDP-glucose/GDP-mannose dehydrogenase family protein [Heliorestis acidaminivorans]KAB2951553.1 UDP-glucose/GDP-mannose dehydrogenase family protein [Heliorestis acidaminivorans]
MDVAVIGTGYVGLVTGASFAFLGHKVICHDVDKAKIEALKKGKITFYEPYLEELVQDLLPKQRLLFTSSLEEALAKSEVIFIAVGTPTAPNTGAVDMTYVRQVARQIGKTLQPHRYYLIVNKSTVPVGTHQLVEGLIQQSLSETGTEKVNFAVASNPEFLREGNAIEDVFYPDRIVVGCHCSQGLALLKTLYEPLIEQKFNLPSSFPARPSKMSKVPFVQFDPISSELIKYASNAFLATKITYINEIANICDLVGADVKDVALGMGLDQRIGSAFLKAGIGWGGSCFGKDLRGLISEAQQRGYSPDLLLASLKKNYEQRYRAIYKLQEELKTLRGKKIGLLGLTFKAKTDDLRDAPALDLIERLLLLDSTVKVFDPLAMEELQRLRPQWPLVYEQNAYDLAEGCHGLILVTEWEQFLSLDWQKVYELMKKPIIVDGRNFLDRQRLEEIGFVYSGMGR